MTKETIKDYTRGELITANAGSTHLPGTFNDVIISNKFLEIDDNIATKTAKEHYSMRLRLQAENSACLKMYASLNEGTRDI